MNRESNIESIQIFSFNVDNTSTPLSVMSS